MIQGPRLALPPYGNGWFHVSASGEVTSEARRVRYFGRTIELRREHGQVHAVSPREVDAPHKRWETEERYGLVYVWHHVDGLDATRTVPELGDFLRHRWGHWHRTTHILRTHSQEIIENVADIRHFSVVHGMQSRSRLVREGEALRFVHDFEHKIFGIRYHSIFEVYLPEPGVQNAYIPRGPLGAEMIIVMSITPIDEHRVASHLSFAIAGAPSRGKKLLGHLLVRESTRMFRQDCAIWENKIFRNKPLLLKEDGPIMQVRRWHEQFYPPTSSRPVAP